MSLRVEVPPGTRFGRLTVVGDGGRERGLVTFVCRCDCGATTRVVSANLRRGLTRSCGCLSRASASALFTKHGEGSKGRESAEYKTWRAMIARCTRPTNNRYADYGARGVTVCDAWRTSFETFLADMGRKPSPLHTIDRKKSDGNYEPDNCRWATPVEQRRNRRRDDIQWVAIGGEWLPTSEAARRLGMPATTLRRRIREGQPITDSRRS